MKTDDVLKMIEAGFTADEIRKMAGFPESSSVILEPEKSKAAPAKEAAPAAPVKEEKEEKEEKKEPEKKEDPVGSALEKAFNDRMDAALSKYDELFGKLAKMAGMPSMEDVKPKGIEDIISNFFKEE